MTSFYKGDAIGSMISKTTQNYVHSDEKSQIFDLTLGTVIDNQHRNIPNHDLLIEKFIIFALFDFYCINQDHRMQLYQHWGGGVGG